MSLFLNLVLPQTSPGSSPVNISQPDNFAFTTNNTLGGVLNSLVPYVMGIVGIILFFMIVAGGYTLLTAVGNPEKVKKGQALLTNALIGFIVIFAGYWIMQALQIIFGLDLSF